MVSLSQQVRRQDRYAAVLEDAEGARLKLTIPDEVVLKFRLREGDELDAARVHALRDLADRSLAFDRGVAALAARDRSAKELERWLVRRGFSQEHAQGAVAKLTALGVVDDGRFAREHVRRRVSGSGASVWRLRRELARKGVDRTVADAAIADTLAEAGTDDLAMARREGAKKWRSLSRLERDVARRRLLGFLRRRAFSGDVVRAVVAELVRGDGASRRA